MRGLRKFRTDSSRRLRRDATDAERRLWRILRELRADGTHFRRQVPIGRFIVDFAILSRGLVIEVDGGQHYAEIGLAADRERDRWLVERGFRVLRFSNLDVLSNCDGVAEAITAALAETPPPPTPPRKGEGSSG